MEAVVVAVVQEGIKKETVVQVQVEKEEVWRIGYDERNPLIFFSHILVVIGTLGCKQYWDFSDDYLSSSPQAIFFS